MDQTGLILDLPWSLMMWVFALIAFLMVNHIGMSNLSFEHLLILRVHFKKNSLPLSIHSQWLSFSIVI